MNQGYPNLVFFTSNQVRKSKNMVMETNIKKLKKKKKTLLPENLLILIITST